MSWDWLLARRIPKAKIDPPPPRQQPKLFSHSVDSGYVDDIGVWYSDKYSADYASAKRLIISGTARCTHSGDFGFSPYQHFDNNMFAKFINEPDTILAMAILSDVKND